MNILETLEKKFNTVEPIFDYEIYELGYTDSDIADTLKENVFEEINIDESFDIKSKAYTLVQYSELFNLYTKVQGNSEQIIIKYYIGNNNEYGYYSYLTLYNKLGLSTQVPNIMYIDSIRVDKSINIGNYIINKIDEYSKEDLPYIYLSTIFNFEYEVEYSLDNIFNKLKDKVVDIDKVLKMTKKERWNKVYEFFTQYK